MRPLRAAGLPDGRRLECLRTLHQRGKPRHQDAPLRQRPRSEPARQHLPIDTLITVRGDLGTAFSAVAYPGVTGYQLSSVGTSTAYLAENETTLVLSQPQVTQEDQFWTVVEVGYITAGKTPAASVLWALEPAPQIPAGQAGARFVLGAPEKVGTQIDLGSLPLASSAALGTVTPWDYPEPGGATLTVTKGSTTTSFAVPALAAGSLHTYALADIPTAESPDAGIQLLRLVDILESPDGGTAGTPIAPAL